MIPLINFEVVEWHRTDRVIRQFSLHQTVPYDTSVALYGLDRRGRPTSTDWSTRHVKQHCSMGEAVTTCYRGGA